MDVKLNIKYQLDLSRDEWLVVSKALRAYATDSGNEDHVIAEGLQQQMLQQKHNVLSQMAHEAGKHVSNVVKQEMTKHYQNGADSCACGEIWPCRYITGARGATKGRKP